MINPFTGHIPESVGDGPLDEIVSIVHYNQTQTLCIEDCTTDMNDLDEVVHYGKRWKVIESRQSRQYGFWDFIKCIRSVID